MNPCTYVCAHCGSKHIFIRAKAIWSEEDQSWRLAPEENLKDVFCNNCRPGTEFPTNKKEVELKTEIVQFEVKEVVLSLAQIKVSPSQLQGLRNMNRDDELEAVERLLNDPDHEFSIVLSNVESREVLEKPIHFLSEKKKE